MCTCSTKRQLHPELHQKQCGQQVKGHKPGCETWGYSAWWTSSGETLQHPSSTYRGPIREGLLTRAWDDRTRGNTFELKEGRFRLDIKKKFFIVRMVKHRNRFPRGDVDAPSLEGFKPMAGGLGLDNLWRSLSTQTILWLCNSSAQN